MPLPLNFYHLAHFQLFEMWSFVNISQRNLLQLSLTRSLFSETHNGCHFEKGESFGGGEKVRSVLRIDRFPPHGHHHLVQRETAVEKDKGIYVSVTKKCKKLKINLNTRSYYYWWKRTQLVHQCYIVFQ